MTPSFPPTVYAHIVSMGPTAQPQGAPGQVWTERIWMIGNMEGDILREPVSLDEVRRDIAAGRLNGHELLARVGTKNWRPIEKAFARAREIESGASAPSMMPGNHGAPSAPALPNGKRPPSTPPPMAPIPQPAGLPSFGAFAAPPVVSERWYLTRPGTPTIGPLTTEQVAEGLKLGQVPADTQVCRVGDSTWTPVGKVPAFGGTLPPSHDATAPALARVLAQKPALVAASAVVLGIVVAVLIYFIAS